MSLGDSQPLVVHLRRGVGQSIPEGQMRIAARQRAASPKGPSVAGAKPGPRVLLAPAPSFSAQGRAKRERFTPFTKPRACWALKIVRWARNSPFAQRVASQSPPLTVQHRKLLHIPFEAGKRLEKKFFDAVRGKPLRNLQNRRLMTTLELQIRQCLFGGHGKGAVLFLAAAL